MALSINATKSRQLCATQHTHKHNETSRILFHYLCGVSYWSQENPPSPHFSNTIPFVSSISQANNMPRYVLNAKRLSYSNGMGSMLTEKTTRESQHELLLFCAALHSEQSQSWLAGPVRQRRQQRCDVERGPPFSWMFTFACCEY